MLKIVDNFYNDPHGVREFALAQDFNVAGNYPGLRTDSCRDENYLAGIRGHLEGIVGKPITYFPDEYNTAFQVTLEDAKTWIHHDMTEWAAVVYLHPDPVLDAGTAIYRHKPTGIMKHEEGLIDFNKEPHQESDWEIVAESKNVFNRMVLYHGMYYHRSVVPGFGKDKHDGRLFQTFFFNT